MPPDQSQPADDANKGTVFDLSTEAELASNSIVSEDSIARAFTKVHGERLRFDHDAGLWYEWDGWRWVPDVTKKAFDNARKQIRLLSRGDKSLSKASVASGVERFAQADRAHAVRQSIWDNNPWSLGTPEGTLDLHTGTLHPPRREDYITKLTSVSPASGRPERWLGFLWEATGEDAELIRFLQQFAGYCLTGQINEHAMLFLYGPGGNGKSVFLNTIIRVLGDYAVTAQMETFMTAAHDRHPAEIAMFNGARLVTASETEENRNFAEARVKALTGGDPITARYMRQNPFTFTPQFKLIMAGNHEPRLRNVDDAIKRRFNIVPFTVSPKNPDRELEAKLEAEHGAILNWMLEGCIDWQQNGLIRPAVVTAATDRYFLDQDVIGRWLVERCTMSASQLAPVSQLYASFKSFAQAEDEAGFSQKQFGSAMKKRGFASETARIGGAPQKAYRGIGLRK